MCQKCVLNCTYLTSPVSIISAHRKVQVPICFRYTLFHRFVYNSCQMKMSMCWTSPESVRWCIHLTTLTLFYVTWTLAFEFDLGDLDLLCLTNTCLDSSFFWYNGLIFVTLTFGFNLDIWPPFRIVGWETKFSCLTLTFYPVLAEIKVNIHVQNEGLRSNNSAVTAPTDRQTEKHTQD